MRYGEVYDYSTIDKAGEYIGKKGVFSNILESITERPEGFDPLILKEISLGSAYPFTDGDDVYQFFRPVLEEEERMSNRQLSEWLARGKGVYICDGSTMVGQKIVSPNYGYLEGDEDKPVEDYIFIRRWRDTEWAKPTKAIYEEDCK